MGKTFRPDAAEREANEIAFRFQNSNDVMGDMSRAYHVDFSNIRIHTDGAADSKVKAAGKDALAKGNDLFFGKGIFESNDPGSKGLLAHELAHTMQQGAAQGGEGAVSEMAPMGAEQGGKLWDWFKGLFGGKKEPEMEISEPTLMDNPTAPGFDGYRINTDDPYDGKRRFMSTQSRAIYQMAQSATPEQLRTDPQLRALILNDYKTNMAKRLEKYEGADYSSMFSAVFRGDSAGEMKTFNKLMGASLPENLAFEMGDIYDEGKQESVDAMLRHGADRISNDPVMMEILQAGVEGIGNSSHFSGENAHKQSEMMMNNVALRGISPILYNASGDQSLEEKQRKHYLKASAAIQKEVNGGKSAGAGIFRRLLDRFRR